MLIIPKKFTHINQMERTFFRWIKPFCWILFALSIVPFFVFLGFFVTNLTEYFSFFSLTSDPGSLNWYQNNVVYTINNIVYYSQALGISLVVILFLRVATKILIFLRTINQYISYAYAVYHNLSKLIVTLIILTIGMAFLILLVVAVFIFYFWIHNIFIDSSMIINSSTSFTSIKDSLWTEINKVNNYHLKEQTTFILLVFGSGGWLLTSITYFVYTIYFVPKLHDYRDEEWKFLELYNQMKPNSRQKQYGPSSSYDEYNNRMTNGFSHRFNPRDKQYEIYKSYDKTKK